MKVERNPSLRPLQERGPLDSQTNVNNKTLEKGASYLTKELSKELSEQNIESIRETWRNLVKLSLNFREKFQ